MATNIAQLPRLILGDDWSIPVTLKIGKPSETFAIDSGATIKARIIDENHTKGLTPTVDVLEASTGSDWANSKVIVNISGSDNTVITSQGKAKIEVQVNDTIGVGLRTFFGDVRLVRGLID